ncbi:hypothetical protein JB92DRAFT_2874880 [Gautieria morchelliformis]|nr:hypothetical protein JB92DRAFT_3036620 [Gautieria morchelliformis]KAF8525754.1 hypothetical protein JB92DRAFT_2874880 [Gautieria morchelliformis]
MSPRLSLFMFATAMVARFGRYTQSSITHITVEADLSFPCTASSLPFPITHCSILSRTFAFIQVDSRSITP